MDAIHAGSSLLLTFKEFDKILPPCLAEMLSLLRFFPDPVHQIKELSFVFIHGFLNDRRRIRNTEPAEIFDEHGLPLLLRSTIDLRNSELMTFIFQPFRGFIMDAS